MPLGLTLFECHQYLRVEFSNSVDPGVLVFVFFVGLGGEGCCCFIFQNKVFCLLKFVFVHMQELIVK